MLTTGCSVFGEHALTSPIPAAFEKTGTASFPSRVVRSACYLGRNHLVGFPAMGYNHDVENVFCDGGVHVSPPDPVFLFPHIYWPSVHGGSAITRGQKVRSNRGMC